MARRTAIGRVIALVTALAVAAPAGAIAQAFGHGGCDACPPSCPMHRTGKPRCHESSMPHATEPERSSPGCKLAQRGCGQHGGERALGLPPAILTPGQVVLGFAPTTAPARHPRLHRSRNADPPDTPPPVVAS